MAKKIRSNGSNLQHFLIDNPVAQKLLLKQLTRLGFHVKCANNGLEAIDAWLNHPSGHFVMAFFDHHMPKVSFHPVKLPIAFLYLSSFSIV